MRFTPIRCAFMLLALVGIRAHAESCPTRYPFALAHGLFASEKFIALRNAAEALRAAGCSAFLTEVSAANSISVRARQLAPQVDAILRASGAGKVNLIGQSMGGLDARYLISQLGYGDRIASLTTLSTPHYGTSGADLLLENASRPTSEAAFRFFNWLGSLISDSTPTGSADFEEALRELTPDYVRSQFNPSNPDDPRVYYQSYGGRASPDSLGSDRLRPLFLPSHYYILDHEGENDGLVPTRSARWGVFREVMPADHFSQIGDGLPQGFPPFDYLSLFLRIAAELAGQGF